MVAAEQATNADAIGTVDEHGIQWWPHGGNTAHVAPLDLHRCFMHDRELCAFAAVVDEVRALLHGACVPRSLRNDLAPHLAAIGALVHAGPHLQARR